MFLQGKLTSSRYIVQDVLLPFFRQEDDVPFSGQRTSTYDCYPDQQDPPDLLPIEHVNGSLLFVQNLQQPLPNCENKCRMLVKIYPIRLFNDRLLELPLEGLQCIDATV